MSNPTTETSRHVTSLSDSLTPCGRRIAVNYDRMFSITRVVVQVQERPGSRLYTNGDYFITDEAAIAFIEKLQRGDLVPTPVSHNGGPIWLAPKPVKEAV